MVKLHRLSLFPCVILAHLLLGGKKIWTIGLMFTNINIYNKSLQVQGYLLTLIDGKVALSSVTECLMSEWLTEACTEHDYTCICDVRTVHATKGTTVFKINLSC